MDFIGHTIEWCKGEIFEARMLLLWGVSVLVLSLLYWKFGSTPFARAMFPPLLLVAVLSIAVGTSMNFSNQKRIIEYQAAYKKDSTGFVNSEKERTEAFIKWYPFTRYIFISVMLAGIGLFLWLPTPAGRAWGLGLMLLGITVLYLDHFSEQRAASYHEQIKSQLR